MKMRRVERNWWMRWKEVGNVRGIDGFRKVPKRARLSFFGLPNKGRRWGWIKDIRSRVFYVIRTRKSVIQYVCRINVYWHYRCIVNYFVQRFALLFACVWSVSLANVPHAHTHTSVHWMNTSTSINCFVMRSKHKHPKKSNKQQDRWNAKIVTDTRTQYACAPHRDEAIEEYCSICYHSALWSIRILLWTIEFCLQHHATVSLLWHTRVCAFVCE